MPEAKPMTEERLREIDGEAESDIVLTRKHISIDRAYMLRELVAEVRRLKGD